MMIEALYKDNHRERFLASPHVTLQRACQMAEELWGGARVKHLKIVQMKGDRDEARPGEH